MKLWCALLFLSFARAGSTYYVDCAAGDDSADGLSRATAWRSVRRISGQQFRAADQILLKRGTRCTGTLWPKGSGAAGAPIVLDAFGEGPLPVIRAQADAEAAFRLFNQEYWTVQHVEFAGGRPHGVYVSGTQGVLHGIHLRELVVHGVTGEPKDKEGGLVVIAPGAAAQRFDDVLVDGVTAYGTSQWAGILVGGVAFGVVPEQARSSNVVVRNSMVHDVAGDGIILFQVNGGSIEDSVAWYTGMQRTQSIGTPNGIWTWMCAQCAVRRSEAFLTDSPGADGGAFDIDYGDADNVVEDSYGHDTQGYCVAVFGAGQVTTNSVVRRNVCVGNGRSPRLAAAQGAVFLSTWDGGKLKGVQIVENRIFWHPPVAAPAVVNTAEFVGNVTMENNTIETSLPQFDLKLRGIHPGAWRLLGYMPGSGGQVAIVASAYRQFHAAGMEAVLTVPGGVANLRWDWNLGGITVQADARASGRQMLMLVNPQGRTVWQHDGPIAPGDLGLVLRRHLGDPDFAHLLSERP
jgi:hypothetical protein